MTLSAAFIFGFFQLFYPSLRLRAPFLCSSLFSFLVPSPYLPFSDFHPSFSSSCLTFHLSLCLTLNPDKAQFLFFKRHSVGFPGGPVVKNLPANAGGHGFDPWSRKIPHGVDQLSPCSTTREATAVRSSCIRTRE